jgi:hypothetical protein
LFVCSYAAVYGFGIPRDGHETGAPDRPGEVDEMTSGGLTGWNGAISSITIIF